MTAIGVAQSRLDGPAKVTGQAHYGSDVALNKAAYAVLTVSSIAKGRISGFDLKEARAIPGVLGIFTYQNIGRIQPGSTFDGGGYMGTSIAPMGSAEIFHDGQIVAIVVADTFEAAREAAHRLQVSYTEETPTATFDSAGVEIVAGADASNKKHKDPQVGDAAGAFASAPVQIDEHYSTATEHHNPIELFASAAAWRGDKLTVWESSQNMYGFKNGLAQQLGIKPDDVHVVSPFVGGAFGSRGSLT